MKDINPHGIKEKIQLSCAKLGSSSKSPRTPPNKLVQKAKHCASFWVDHVKKGEMPWTHWYCCQAVNGIECERENHRLHKECKKCHHRVCENCVKGTL
ncbi:hypothetical protein K3495_g2752 [Podosphaera aphanis]|nr:hypothetical protein K3495_g2752 [Podosphaera aphanis]